MNKITLLFQMIQKQIITVMSSNHLHFILRILKPKHSQKCFQSSTNHRTLSRNVLQVKVEGQGEGGDEGGRKYSYQSHNNYGSLKDMHEIMRFCHAPAKTRTLLGVKIPFCGHAIQSSLLQNPVLYNVFLFTSLPL